MRYHTCRSTSTQRISAYLAALQPRLTRYAAAQLLPLVTLLGIALLYATPSPALQPAYVNGAVFSAFDNSLIYNAVIKTTTGLTYRTVAGTFTLRVPPGVYNFICEAPGYTTNFLGGIRATPGSTALVTLWLVPSSTPTCIVEGKLCDASSFSPIADGIIAADLGGAATTDADGYFSMIVPSGTASFTVGAAGYATKITQSLALRPGHTERVIIYLKKKRSDTMTATGLVKNQCSGEKLASARLFSFTGTAVSDKNGTFSLPLETGPSMLIASAPGFQYGMRAVTFTGYIIPPIVSLNLLPSKNGFGLVRGTVLNAHDGMPCENVKIISNTGAISFTDSAGRFKIYTSTCTSYLTITGDQFIPKTLPVSVNAGAITTVSVSVEPAANQFNDMLHPRENTIISADTEFSDHSRCEEE